MENGEIAEELSDEEIEFIKNQEAEDEHKYEEGLLILNELDIKRIFKYAIQCSEKTNSENFDKLHKAFNIQSQIYAREKNLLPNRSYNNEKRSYYVFQTVLNVQVELMEIINSSIFLAFIGKYKPALILLRQWLEQYIIAIRYDLLMYDHLKKSPEGIGSKDKGTKTCDQINGTLENREKWLSGVVDKKRSFKDYLKTFEDKGINDKIKCINKNYFLWFKGETDFLDVVTNLYSDLSKVVHIGNIKPSYTIEKNYSFEIFYSKDYFEDWYYKFVKVNDITSLLLVFSFPMLKENFDEKIWRNCFPFNKKIIE
ncbi:MAG: hypothetical protein OIN86_06845 [Candidatus Methanoperedens sp.]|nr:hypothetical protein [Candidatus Methanoperedens sp.]